MPRRTKASGHQRFANELRKRIRQSKLNYTEIARRMGHDRCEIVVRFLDGMDSQISTVEAIAEALGYEIVLKKIEGR